jgi:RHS repeat-associated protein
LIGQRDGNGSSYYLFDGHPGSVVGVTNGSGALTARLGYDPYGNLTSSSGTPSNPWRFAGQYLDGQTGLYKMGARYDDPAVGRWTQQDPLSQAIDPKQADRYVYAGDNPVNVADPSGKQFPLVEDFLSAASDQVESVFGGGSCETSGHVLFLGGTGFGLGYFPVYAFSPEVAGTLGLIGSGIDLVGVPIEVLGHEGEC